MSLLKRLLSSEDDLTRQWIAAAHSAQKSLSELGWLAQRFRERGREEEAKELEQALVGIAVRCKRDE